MNLSNGALSTAEIINGLKAALQKGTSKGTSLLAKTDGFYKNPSVKILFPPEAKKVEDALRRIGLGNLADQATMKINRAAEDASKSAKNIFIDAIRKMTVKDGMNILMGEKNAATKYFERTTNQKLYGAFIPVIRKSLDKVGANKAWTTVIQKYNKFPTTRNKVNPKLDDYVTKKAMSGVYHMIEKEERGIRANPRERTTALLKKVFAKQDKK